MSIKIRRLAKLGISLGQPGRKLHFAATPESHRRTKRRRLLVEHLGDRRVLAAITGVVFDDVDHSFRQEPGEVALPNRLAYIDANENGSLDGGERVAFADEIGQFSFDGVADGVYQVRLFNGTQTQHQLFPIDVSGQSDAIEIAGGLAVFFDTDGQTIVQTESSVEILDFETSSAQSLSVGGTLANSQRLPDGRLLLVGDASDGPSAWIVDSGTATVAGVDLQTAVTQPSWANVAIDPNGIGVLIEAASEGETTTLRSIDASDPEIGIVVTDTLTTVPNGTVAMTASASSSSNDPLTGTRTVLAWAGESGIQLSLWSNTSKSMISDEPVEVSGTSKLLSFDDEHGLAVLRELDGGVTVVDTDGFAPLYSFDDLTGPVSLDAKRELLFSILPNESVLRITDLRSGDIVTDLAVDLSSIGGATAVATDGSPGTVTILGNEGVMEVALKRPDAHRVTVENNQDPLPVGFAMQIDDIANQAPLYESTPSLTTIEDVTLNAPGAALHGVVDDENDDLVVIQQGGALHGSITIDVDGGVIYTPDADYFGVDEVSVVIHDGINRTGPVVLNLLVTPVPDPPSDVVITLYPSSEALGLDGPVGLVEVIDVDGLRQPGEPGDHVIRIEEDPRFVIDNGVIIFVGGTMGDGLDFETEPRIPLRISVTDSETETEIIRDSVLTINDANDPMTEIIPHEISIDENVDGGTLGVIAELLVIDQDTEQFHTYTVDDDRFVVEDADLRIKPGVSFDYEASTVVTINVTATEFDTKETFTQPITIRINDVFEQPQTIELVGDTILELIPGEEVGTVTVDGTAPGQGVVLTVDDSRFEIDGQTLKLRDDESVEWAVQNEIELTIRAEDAVGTVLLTSAPYVISVIRNRSPFHNRDNPYDVNLVDGVTASDALMIINHLNDFGSGPIGHGDPRFGLDVNADGLITAVDALLVINEINRTSENTGTVGGEESSTDAEGEALAEAKQSDTLSEGEDLSPDARQYTETQDRAIVETTEKTEANHPSWSIDRASDEVQNPSQTTAGEDRDDFDPLDETLRLLTDAQ
ncbi:Dockerin type I repeat protein [Novipirellula aureliae]|uniref:Dockerin type I repeat protein n=1 Tax=Novipirellula aureliae TaxID=2527966 RepID=A0A5C6DLK8_9BACT|nr:dockerin type I domain-containing protein [Novipirellula aureliae]TWU36697.1 Dockerin type I repeat protein [Novipirellula aureliae]